MLRTFAVLFLGVLAEGIVLLLFWAGPTSRWFGVLLLLSFVAVPFLTLWVLSQVDSLNGVSGSNAAAWSPDTLPPLVLGADTVRVEIGHLGGEVHRQAFAAIFAKMIFDNRDTLERFELVNIEAVRRVAGLDQLPTPFASVSSAATSFGLGLYDSHNEKVILKLVGAAEHADLGVRFDEPEFWLSPISD